jgi:hypothetical protein
MAQNKDKKIQHRDRAGNIRHMTQNKDKKIQHRDTAGNIRHMTQNKDKKYNTETQQATSDT